MTIDQPGQNGHLRQIDDFGPVRYGQVRTDGFDFHAANENDLVREHTSRLHIDELAGTDGGDGRRGTGGGLHTYAQRRQQGQPKRHG